MNIWIVAWLPFMASPFDREQGVMVPGVDGEQALENARAIGCHIGRTDMLRIVEANTYYGVRPRTGRAVQR